MPSDNRYWEVDVARGVAVLEMIAYHSYVVGQYPYAEQPLRWLAIVIASTFIIISGISVKIGYNRGHKIGKFLKRSLKIGICAIIITIGTYVFLGDDYVRFGILHFIALSSLLSYPIFKLGEYKRALLGSAIILFHFLFPEKAIGNVYTLILGFYPPGFHSVDYFPLIPWLGLFLFGSVISDILYPKGKRAFNLKYPDNNIVKALSVLGRKSLLIYMVHVPLIYLVWELIKTLS